MLKDVPIFLRVNIKISQGFKVKPRAYISAGIICVGSTGPLCAVCGLPTHMGVGSGICKGLGAMVAWGKGREGSVEEVGLGGLGEGHWGGGNCLSERVKKAKSCEVQETGTQAE